MKNRVVLDFALMKKSDIELLADLFEEIISSKTKEKVMEN